MDQSGEAAGTSAAVDAELYAARAASEVMDFANALAAYEAALTMDPGSLDAMTGKGCMLRALGQTREALPILMKVLDLDSRHLDARLELALTLQSLGRSDEARAIFSSLVREPEPPARAWHGLALLLLGEGHEAAAEIALRRALALGPDLTEARQQLADLLARRLHLAAAIDLYHDVLAMDPGNSQALAGLGQALLGLGRMDEASDQLERALAVASDNPQAHLGRARLNLLEGNLPAGWDELEWRWRASGRQRPEPPGQGWNGDDDLHGHTILLWAEQGQGEIISQLRYVAQVAHRAGKVVLGLPPALLPLAQGLDGVFAAVASGQPLPAHIQVDYNASLADLPRLFGTALNGIPPAPYLSVPAGHGLNIAAAPASLLKVGLAWAGQRAGWNIPFPQMLSLASLPGAVFFGLQLGSRAQDCGQLAHPSLITDLSPTISDFGDLAARIAEMDLVITVDSAVAHLAGALGKPVWILLSLTADWCWMRGRDDSPWYPSARLFRQSRAGDWLGVITQVMGALDEKLAHERDRRQKAAHGQSGARAAQRAFLSSHLKAGDLMIDVGCGADGTHALDAAYQMEDAIQVLALDARASEAALLDDTVAIAGLAEVISVRRAVIGATAATVAVAKRKRDGRAVFALPEWVGGDTRSHTLAQILDDEPQWQDRRLILRLGAKGGEAEILAGLGRYRPAVVVFQHQNGAKAADWLGQHGYHLFHFTDAIATGAAMPFDGTPGTVLALAGNEPAFSVYGDAADPTSPARMARAIADAAGLAAEASTQLHASQINQAGRTLARALALDPSNADANANLGGLLRRIGRADAAAACWRRALAAGAPPMVRANLANVLRESGHLESAQAAFLQAMLELPDTPALLYAFGLLEREMGHPREALGLLEKAESLRAGTVPGGELAATLLKSGNLARGMAEMGRRRPVTLSPISAPDWDGSRLAGKTILVRDENDIIDTLQLARYIPLVALQGGLVTVECHPELVPLLSGLAGVERAIARGQALPMVDCTVRLPDVPRLLGTTSRTTPPRAVPYLHLPEGRLAFRFPGHDRLHVGVSWAGNRPRDRAVPLSVLMKLAAEPGIDLISLQRGERARDLVTSGNRLFVEDMGGQCRDLADQAAIIAGLDLIITTDTAEAHLAGAMGRPVWVLLPLGNDWRWVDDRDDSVWYPTMRVFRQAVDGSWTQAITRIAESLAAIAAGKRSRAR